MLACLSGGVMSLSAQLTCVTTWEGEVEDLLPIYFALCICISLSGNILTVCVWVYCVGEADRESEWVTVNV